jgi:lysophospholipase L1-like esterase
MRILRPVFFFSFALIAAPVAALPPDFSKYVALGDSFMAGVVSNALVESHQERSIPALIARQAGVAGFQQALVSEPGIPSELTLVTLGPAAVILPKSGVPGGPRNGGLSGSYHNLSIPNSTAGDLVTRTGDAGGMHDLVLRGKGSALEQAVALKPTLVTLWTGNDEVLGAVLRGRAVDGQTLTPTATFRANFQQIVQRLRTAGAQVIAGNVLDVTALPFATTVRPHVVDGTTGEPVRLDGNLVPLLGPSGPLTAGTLVTFVAAPLISQGTGVPTSVGGKGTPLPDEVILDPAEQALIRERVAEFNRAIEEVCLAAGVPVVDIQGFYTEFVRRGQLVGGIHITNFFLTGGFWSFDGVHPTELGYALLANEWIDEINAAGGQIAPATLAPYLKSEPRTTTSQRPGPFFWTAEAQQALREMFGRRP